MTLKVHLGILDDEGYIDCNPLSDDVENGYAVSIDVTAWRFKLPGMAHSVERRVLH